MYPRELACERDRCAQEHTIILVIALILFVSVGFNVDYLFIRIGRYIQNRNRTRQEAPTSATRAPEFQGTGNRAGTQG